MKYKFILSIAVAGLFAGCSSNEKPVDLAASDAKSTNNYQVAM
jgi:hypothetical protein